MRFAELDRNLILTVIAALMALIAFQRGGAATVQAQKRGTARGVARNETQAFWNPIPTVR
jgi:hypothetical protein